MLKFTSTDLKNVSFTNQIISNGDNLVKVVMNGENYEIDNTANYLEFKSIDVTVPSIESTELADGVEIVCTNAVLISREEYNKLREAYSNEHMRKIYGEK